MQGHPHKDFLLSSLTFKSENVEKSSEFRDNIAFLLPAQLASYRIYIRRRIRAACLRRFLDVWQRVKEPLLSASESRVFLTTLEIISEYKPGNGVFPTPICQLF